jgi:hypothetical protein
MAPQRTLASLDQADGDWDTFSADVTVTMTGGDINGRPAAPQRQMAYHTERTLTADSAWSSSLTFTQFPFSPQLGDHRVNRITFDEGTGEKHIYDLAGRELHLPARDSLPPSLKPPTNMTWIDPVSRPSHGHNNSRDWADRIRLGPASRDRSRTLIERTFGKPTQNDKGRDVYRLTQGDNAIELIRDPATGLILEHNVLRKGKRAAHTTYAYTESSPGVFVSTSTHSELTPDDTRIRALLIDQTFSNVQFTKRGGQP